METTMPDLAAPMAAGGFIAMLAGIWLIAMLFVVAFYVFGSLAWMKMGNSLRYENSWLAWVPVWPGSSIFLIASLADLPIVVPVVLVAAIFLSWIPYIGILFSIVSGLGGIVFTVYATLVVARKLGKPEWYCVGIFIPLLQLWVLYDMGWNAQPVTAQTTTTWEPPAGQAPPPPPPPPAE